MNVLLEQDGWLFAVSYMFYFNGSFQNRMNVLSEQDGWLFAVLDML